MKRETKTNIGTLNVRSLKNEERVIELLNAVKKTKIDIFGVGEVRRKDEKIIRRNDGYTFYHFGKTNGQRGVGFIINNNIADKIIEYKGFSERIGFIKISFKNNKILTLIQEYAPTAETEEKECEDLDI